MKVRFTALAVTEIDQVYSYIATRNPAAANEILAQLDRTIALLSDHPQIGPIKYRGFVRMLPLRRYPQYLLFYSIEDGQIVILNLRHAARRPLWADEES
jgi:plasmid stabilization system protein ParE